MKKRISTWFLFKNSWGLFKQKPQIMLFPVISTLLAALVMVLYFVGSYFLLAHGVDSPHDKINFHDNSNMIYVYILLAAAYFIGFTLSTLVNAAMVSYTAQYLDTGNVTVWSAFKEAFKHIWVIIQWSLLACSIGILLKWLEERFPIAGFIARIIFGVAWALGTYFVIPFLVYENMGPFKAVKSSAKLFTETWGNQVKFAIGGGILEVFLILLSMVVFGACGIFIGVSFKEHAGYILFATFAAWIVFMVFFALISNSLVIIFKNLLFRYATHRSLPATFNIEKLDALLAEKK